MAPRIFLEQALGSLSRILIFCFIFSCFFNCFFPYIDHHCVYDYSHLCRTRSLRRTPHNVLIINLACSDLLMVFTMFPVMFISVAKNSWVFGDLGKLKEHLSHYFLTELTKVWGGFLDFQNEKPYDFYFGTNG